MENKIDKIRAAEAKSHTEAYTNLQLFTPGSWLAKPVKTVLDLLPLFKDYNQFRGLDLGCGVGRNCIALAQYLKNIPCHVDCVDILQLAIEKLQENAEKYQVGSSINGILSAIDTFDIQENHYDFIMAISALEHIESPTAFTHKLHQIRDGLRSQGIACFIVNSGVIEHDKETGDELVPQFEVNLPTKQMEQLLMETFDGWEIIKRTIVHQHYDIPRDGYISALETDVVTLVVRKK